jgi:hypothetical protein
MLVEIPGTKLVRDTNSMALINMDTAARDEYYAKVKILTNQKEEINKVKTEINDIKSELTNIKDLLIQLLQKG